MDTKPCPALLHYLACAYFGSVVGSSLSSRLMPHHPRADSAHPDIARTLMLISSLGKGNPSVSKDHGHPCFCSNRLIDACHSDMPWVSVESFFCTIPCYRASMHECSIYPVPQQTFVGNGPLALLAICSAGVASTFLPQSRIIDSPASWICQLRLQRTGFFMHEWSPLCSMYHSFSTDVYEEANQMAVGF